MTDGSAPEGGPNDEEVDIGDTARAMIGFVESKSFKIIVGICSVAGIAYALSTGGLRSSGVPAPNEGVVDYQRMTERSPWAQQVPRRPPGNTGVHGRFREMQKRNSGN